MVASPSAVWSPLEAVGPAHQSIDELDVAIRRLARELNAGTYRLLMLVRDFDDRMGWAKWSFRHCAEWLAWRCGLSMSAAREQVRTAQALRWLPAISAAFADGRLSYSKVRALTRVAHLHDEDTLLTYALDATAVQVEERCRQIRNVAPDSVEIARRAWERRGLSVLRNAGRGTLCLMVEVPIEEGELIVQALERAVEARGVSQGPDSAAEGWQAQQADALVAVAKAYLAGGADGVGASSATPDNYQVVVHVDEAALRGGPSPDLALHGGIPRSDLPIETIKRLTCDGSVVTVVEDDRGTPLDVGRKQRRSRHR
jgi:hypothetical protein